MTDRTIVFYRNCFSTPDGRRTLSNMLAEAKFFDVLKTPEETAVENFMKVVLCKIGCYDIGHSSDFVDKLFEIPPLIKKENAND